MAGTALLRKRPSLPSEPRKLAAATITTMGFRASDASVLSNHSCHSHAAQYEIDSSEVVLCGSRPDAQDDDEHETHDEIGAAVSGIEDSCCSESPSWSQQQHHHHHQDRKRKHTSTRPSSSHQQDQQEETAAVMTTTTRFKDIIGHGAVKLRIDEILLPLALPTSLADKVLTGIRALPTSILLYGPPGCGKTQLAQAMAGEARAAFLSVSPSDILSKFVGESESAVRRIFTQAKMYASQLESKCTVLFFDEVDALGQSRSDRGSGEGEGCSRRVLAELLLQLNRISDRTSLVRHEEWESSPDEDEGSVTTTATSSPHHDTRARVLVVAATNRVNDCDPALLRRFAISIHVGQPSLRDRKKMLAKHLSKVDNVVSPEELHDLAVSCEGWSGSEIESLAREAAMSPVRECVRAAALLRKRASKQQAVGDASGQEEAIAQMLDPDVQARNTLLDGLQKLRPVSIDDFERAVDFFLGRQATKFGLRAGSATAFETHYDSLSEDDQDG